MPSWFAIANRASGSANDESFDLLKSAFAQEGTRLEWLWVESGSAEDHAKNAIAAGAEGLVVCGGDGTVMRVVNGLVESEADIPLGIMPCGTANIIARSLEIPTGPEEALKIIQGRKVKRIDLGQCNGEAFALGAGFGAAERFVTRTDDIAKKRLGPAAYLLSLIRELRSPPIQFHLISGDKAHKISGAACVVANAAGLGNQLKLVHAASIEDGLLDFVVVKRLRLQDLIRLSFKGLRGQAHQDWDVEHFQWASATLDSMPPVPIQLDGDACDQTKPFAIQVLPKRLQVLTGELKV